MLYSIEITACSYNDRAILSGVETRLVAIRADSRREAAEAALLDPSLSGFGSLYIESIREV